MLRAKTAARIHGPASRPTVAPAMIQGRVTPRPRRSPAGQTGAAS
jgi:hypothetical protein